MNATDVEINEAVTAYLETERAAIDAAIKAAIAPYVEPNRVISVRVNGEWVSVTIDLNVSVDVGPAQMEFSISPPVNQ